jgi:hypothetical protein
VNAVIEPADAAVSDHYYGLSCGGSEVCDPLAAVSTRSGTICLITKQKATQGLSACAVSATPPLWYSRAQH